MPDKVQTRPDDTFDLAIEGMNCASCVARVEKALKAMPGVSEASVNLATERAVVRARIGTADEAGLVAAIRQAGYAASAVSNDAGVDSARHQARADETATLRRALLIAAGLSLPVFAIEMGAHVFPAFENGLMATLGHSGAWYLEFALTTLVLFGPGLRFFKTGIPGFWRLSPDMNSLVALGTGAAYGYSVAATFLPSIFPAGTVNVYYEAAAVIVTLILFGRYLEAKAKGRTSDAIAALMKLRAVTARVLRDGRAIEVPIDDVRVGDVAQIRPGESVPVDGEVIAGSSFVDESLMTGEPIAVRKNVGARVIGGTINKNGNFSFRVTGVGQNTVLAQIVRMIERAQGAKLPIQALVDRVTGWFVPAVIAIAALTFLVWYVLGPEPSFGLALVNMVAVLIIACPCAMGLATPTSIMVGTGRAAQLGILFRNGEALQSLGGLAVIAFDKTGTLTEGGPRLTDLVVREGMSESDVLRMAASVEEKSEHPLASAIVTAARERGLVIEPVDKFESYPGLGVSATTEGRSIAIGSDRFMEQRGIAVATFTSLAEDLATQGKSPLYMACDEMLAAIIAVADPIKPSAAEAIAALHALGLKVAMITGDNRATAAAIARQVGIDDVSAQVLPDGKVAALNRLRASFGAVGFVGDGINDAPALAESDVGLAVGSGTDIAIESADVVLMSGDLRVVATAVVVSRATLRNVKENLFWAFGYNLLLVPLAAGVLYPATGLLLSPIFAAGAMALSSVFVVGNALRLRRLRPTFAGSPDTPTRPAVAVLQ